MHQNRGEGDGGAAHQTPVCTPPDRGQSGHIPVPPTRACAMDITNDTVTEVTGKISRGAGPGGAESVSLQHWLLYFGAASGELRLTATDFVECLGNGRPPWDAYRALMSGRLITLEKQPWFRPSGVGGTWRRLMAKCVLRVTGQEAKAACGIEQLTGGVEVGIEVVIIAMRLLWSQNPQEEDWGFLLIDVWNTFNE